MFGVDIKMNKKLLSHALMLLVLLSITLIGCNKVNIKPGNKLNNTIMVYNAFDQKFIPYDTKTSTIPTVKSKDNIFQYSFKTKSPYYTSGDSFYNNFEIVKLTSGAIETVYTLENEETDAVFPLATDGENYFFTKATYLGDLPPSFVICKFQDNKLMEYPNNKGAICNGALLDNKLYYTTYNQTDDKYSLYVLDYSDMSNKANLINNNLEAGELLILNKKLYISDNNSIYCDNDSFKKASENFYDIESNTLIQLNRNESDILCLKVIDAATKKEVKYITDIIGFIIENNDLIAYRNGSIEKFKLPK